MDSTLRKKESQNGSPRRAIWLSVTQLSIMKKKVALLTKESRFSKLLSWLSFFSQCTQPVIQETTENYSDETALLKSGVISITDTPWWP